MTTTMYNQIEIDGCVARGMVQLKNGTWASPEYAAKIEAKSKKIADEKAQDARRIRATQDAQNAALYATTVKPVVKPSVETPVKRFFLANDQTEITVEFVVGESTATILTKHNNHKFPGRLVTTIEDARQQYAKLKKQGYRPW